MSLKKSHQKKSDSKSSIIAPPASPAMRVSENKVCSVDTLNVFIDQLIHSRDALIGVEQLESMEDDKPMIEMRERIQKKVHQQAEALKGWRAQG